MTALTLILPLKGRALHTMRFFWHAERRRLPYRIVVADGQVEPGIAGRLEPPHALFPSLDIDYVRCPDDSAYRDYFNKLAMAAARVTTPYAMLCDNDDFVVPAGVEACIAFLDGNRDHAGVSGGVAGFALHRDPALPKVAGPIGSIGSLYHDGYFAQSHDAPELMARVRANFAGGYALYYSVFRTDVLATVLGDMAALGLSDLKAAETFFGARAKTLGKCRLDRRVVSYVRQAGSSGGAPEVWSIDDLRGGGPRAAEVQRCLTALARPIAAADGAEEATVVVLLRELFVSKLMREAQDRAQAAATPRQVWRDNLREAARMVAPRGIIDFRRHRLRRKAYDEIASSMRAHGATAVEIATVRADIRAIEATLEGPAFPAFLDARAWDLLPRETALPERAPAKVAG